jgi:cephalosporin hydroxylase
MNDEQKFSSQCLREVSEQGSSDTLKSLTRQWVDESIKTNYSYHFEWLGRPVIQYPQDLVGTQQLLWSVQPDLIIETGIARGGSLIFYASMLELIAQCGGPPNAKVLGIDIDIRKHNEDAILEHPMAKRIEMIQGSSIEKSVADEVTKRATSAQKVMVCLDSNHTHEHVLQELRLYAPLVSLGSYVIVFDTVVEDLPSSLIKDRPWAKGNNPKTAVSEYLQEIKDKNVRDEKGVRLQLEIDNDILSKLMISVAPSGYLRRR